MTRDAIAKERSAASDLREGALLPSDPDPSGPAGVVDPMMQILLSMAPRGAPLSTPSAEPPRAPDMRTPMEQLMSKLVRRVAWSGNARTGTARLELGAGELEGATLMIHADNGAVRVVIDLPPGVDRAAWRDRIAGKLGTRGLHVEDVEIA